MDKDRPLCSVCNRNKAMKSYRKGSWTGRYLSKCSTCSRGYASAATKRRHERLAELIEGMRCSNLDCTATIIDPCQLDIDHINGDHKDNRPENLTVLCANCHRVKTKTNRDIRLEHR